MFKIFSELRIKYSDHRLLYIPFIYFLAISLVLWFIWGIDSIPFMLALLLVIVLIIQIHLYRQQRIDNNHQQRNTQALIDLHSRIQFRLPLPSLDNWIASPELISTIYRLMKIHKPRVIVELGSGASTVCCGYFVEDLGLGRVISLDHDEAFAQQTTDNMRNHELGSFVEVIYAPLIQQELDGKTTTWYDISALESVPEIDLLIVDGPPQKTQPHARYPALPLLFTKLSKQAVIILDDASRSEEQEVIRRWCRNHPDLQSEFIPSEKGICILRRKSD